MRISINETPDEKDEYLAEVDYREARLCEDYILINHDLEDAIFFTERVLASLRELGQSRALDGHFGMTQDESRKFEADWIAAVVKYYRCFRDGVRTRLLDSIFESLEGASVAHEYFLELRHKHIVHAVNGYEQAKVYIVLPPQGTANPSVLSVGGFASRRTLESPENTEAFLNLAKHAKVVADQLFTNTQRQVFERAQQDSIESLYARPYASIATTGGVDTVKTKRPDRPRGWQS